MTREDWEKSTDPRQMLLSVSECVTDRKLRLLAVAFCRRILHLVGDEKQKENVEIAELCADGLLPLGKLKEQYDGAELTSFIMGKAPVNWRSEHYALGATGDVVDPDPYDAADNTRFLAEYALHPPSKSSLGGEVTDTSEC